MRRLIFTLHLVVSLGLVSGCATKQAGGSYDRNYDFSSVEKVAVATVEGSLESEAAKQQLIGMFNMNLLDKGYSIVERQQIRDVMDERDFQSSGVTRASKMGKILNTDAAIIVNVPSYKKEMSISAKMIDVQSGSVVWTANGTAKTGEALSQVTSAIGGSAVGGVIGSGASDGDAGATAAGGGVGGVAGAVAGKELAPQKAEQASKLIKELFKELPAKSGEITDTKSSG